MSTPANALDVTQAGLVKFDGVSVFTGVTVTNHDVLVGSTSNGITSVSPSTAGFALISNGISVDPSFQAIPNASLPGSGAITLSNGTNITVTGSPVALGGTATIAVTGTTNHAIQIGNSSGSLTSVSVLSNGQLLIGSTGADPVAGTLTAGSGITISNAAGSITISATGGSVVPNLTYISSATESGGVISFTSLSSTYKGYRFYYEGLTPSTTTSFIAALSTNNGSSYDTGNHYSANTFGLNGLTVAGGTSTQVAVNGYIDVYFTATANALVTGSDYWEVLVPSYYLLQSNVNAISFQASQTATITAGTIYQYGIS